MRKVLALAFLALATGMFAQAPPAPPAPPAPAAIGDNDQIKFAPATGQAMTLPSRVSPFFECANNPNTRQNWHSSSDTDRLRWVVSMEGNGCSLDLHAEGVLTFARDLSGLTEISPGGFFEVEERAHGQRRRLEAKPEANGSVAYSWWVDGASRSYDADGKAWFQSLLLGLDRQSGFAAAVRVPDLLRQGGTNAVLNEIAQIHGDYARGRYYSVLFESAKLDGAGVQRVLEQVRHDMTSDYEIGRVLTLLAAKYDLDDETSRAAYLRAIENMKSDYERGRVLLPLLNRPNLSRQTLLAALATTEKMRSDYERGRVLANIAAGRVLDEAVVDRYLESVAGMSSEYEQGRVYTALLTNHQLTNKQVVKLLSSVEHIRSDYELGRVLTVVSDHYKLEGEVGDAFMHAVHQMRSEYERNRVLAASGRSMM